MRHQRIIGRFFAEDWQAALANSGSFYTPEPATGMSLTELNSIKKTLEDLIAYWSNQVLSNTAWEAQANAQAIADLQQTKLDKVNAIISQMMPVPVPNGGSDPVTDEPAQTKKSWLPALLVAGVAAYFFLKRKRAA